MKAVWIAGYAFRDDEGNDRWAQLEGGPLFDDRRVALTAAMTAGYEETADPRSISVYESVQEWRNAREAEVRREATRKILLKAGLTDEEKRVMGL